MKYLLSLLLSCLCSLALFGQDGSNLAYNGDFQEFQDGVLNGWAAAQPPYGYYRTEEGRAYLAIRDGGDPTVENKTRQRNITLVPGETYRLSAQVRTRDFSAKLGELVVINQGWHASVGLTEFPANTDGWTSLEKVFTCPDSTDITQYEIVLITQAQQGELDVTDIQLIPLSGDAIADSHPAPVAPLAWRARLIPWTPCFNQVPLYHPVVSFVWYGAPNKDFRVEEHQLQAMIPGTKFVSPAQPLAVGEPMELDLSGVPAGEYDLYVQTIRKSDDCVDYQEVFHVNLRDIPRPEEATPGRRLNNMVTELLCQKTEGGEALPLVTSRDQWLYITLREPAEKPFRVFLDGEDVTDELTGLSEAFRMTPAGRHTVAASTAGTLVVHAIPELFSCALLEGPRVTEFPLYDWEFARKWAFPAVTSCNRGVPTDAMLQDIHASGRIWTGNLNAVNPPSVAEMKSRMRETLPREFARLDGVTADELFYDFSEIDNYTQAIKEFDYDRSKLLYTWVTNMPRNKVVHTDFIAATMNASNGRGRLLREAYIPANTLDEAEARRDAEKDMLEFFQLSSRFYPGYMQRAGFILGNFNQLNVITLEHYPQVDYKYYLDLQMNILANDPTFEGLGMTGYWGTHYCDEEMYRWSHALLRHYAVEGNTTMLSDQYGFTYAPGHLVNNDFEDGLEGWIVEAAAEGSIATDSLPEYHDINQDRWGTIPKGCGDSFCVMHVMEGKPNRISQKLQGLVPGKQYMLLFSVGDLDDLRAQRLNPKRIGFQAILANADIDESFVYVDARETGNYARNSGVARQNLHRIIFTPKAEDVTLTFTDSDAIPGENIMFNYVQVKPFFPKVEYYLNP